MNSISIIIPLYNASNYIIRCLESVASQKYPSLECVIVDDGCSDNSVTLVSDYMRAYHEDIQFKLIHHEHNKGASAARNTGIRHASGDYLFFLDADDELEEGGMAALAGLLQTQDLDFIVGPFVIVENESRYISRLGFLHHETLVEGQNIFQSYIQYKFSANIANKLVNKNFLLREQLFFNEELRMFEDPLWLLTLTTCAQTMGICPLANYIRHCNSGSLSNTPLPAKFPYQKYFLQALLHETLRLHKENNYAVINYLEGYKRLFIAQLFSQKDSRRLAKCLYYETSHTLAARNFIKQPLNQKIKNFHAILPKWLGFYYIVLLFYASKWVRSFNHV
jgi:Glycosyltransferases involved in cell wall biogenesis